MAFQCKRLAALLLLASAAGTAAAQQGNPRDAEIVQSLRHTLSLSFVLDRELPLDPDLRSEAGAIASAHLARIDTLLAAWVQEAQLEATQHGIPVYYPVQARLFNELALWQIAPGDDAYERDTLAVLMSAPRVCDVAGDGRFNDFANRIMRIQAMPAARRAAALDTERALLARWNTARPAPPAWPLPLPQHAALAALANPRQGTARRPLSPMLASAILSNKTRYEELPAYARCALQQWWLQERVRHGAAPAEALAAFRYGTMITVAERSAGVGAVHDAERGSKARGTPSYPAIATFFQAGGSTAIRVRFDAAGKAVDASVVARAVTVPGIRGVRPLAFETIFDQEALRHALEGRRYDTDPAPEFTLAWRPRPPDGAATGGGK